MKLYSKKLLFISRNFTAHYSRLYYLKNILSLKPLKKGTQIDWEENIKENIRQNQSKKNEKKVHLPVII